MKSAILTLVLSGGGSLTRWGKDGIFNREMRLYLEFIKAGTFRRIQIFSYNAHDRELVRRLAQKNAHYQYIDIIVPRTGNAVSVWKSLFWSVWGPISQRRVIAKSTVLKTNQISGSWSAMLASLITGRPLILRLGYLLSRRHRKNRRYFLACLAIIIEKLAFRMAERIVVTSKAVQEMLIANGYGGKTTLAPPYFDPEIFTVKQEYDFSKPLVTVARATPQKNLASLIRACSILDMPLTIYGDGVLHSDLMTTARQIGARVNFAGTISNELLGERLQEHTIFVLPSLHEGLPKALVEAMACGLVCAASRIPGVTDLIEDKVTGHLIDGHEPKDIARTLRDVLDRQNTLIGQAAYRFAHHNFCIEQYLLCETKIIADIA